MLQVLLYYVCNCWQEKTLSEVSGGGREEETRWFDAVNADDVEAVREMLQQGQVNVNMADEVSCPACCQLWLCNPNV